MSVIADSSPLSLSGNPEDIGTFFSAAGVESRLRWLGERFQGQLMASTSFGLQSAVMLSLLREHLPEVPVVFVDTGYHFPETYRYAETLQKELDFEALVYQPRQTAARQEALHGKLWEQGEEGLRTYALMNKVEPMNRALQELKAKVWISGLRRTQSTTREDRAFAELQRETLKVYPILDWADAQISSFMHERRLPRHPLEALGYVTMGDWHSTRPLTESATVEETRFNGEKYECGLHEASTGQDFQI